MNSYSTSWWSSLLMNQLTRIFFRTSAFDKLCMRHRAVEGRTAVWQIAKRRACVSAPTVTVGRINSPAVARIGPVRQLDRAWTNSQNQPLAPTGRTKATRSHSVEVMKRTLTTQIPAITRRSTFDHIAGIKIMDVKWTSINRCSFVKAMIDYKNE